MITGVIIFACLTIYLGIKRAFSGVEELRSSEEQSDYEEG